MLQEKTEKRVVDQKKHWRKYNGYRTKIKSNQPWYVSWGKSRQRCNNPNHNRYKNYGGRGIKQDLSFWAMGVLYWRDNAHLMKSPTIDRLDNDGDYTFQNCRFIERSENSRKDRIGTKRSKETREKIRKHKTGKKLSKETRAKIGFLATGRKVSKETRKKISDGLKKHFKIN